MSLDQPRQLAAGDAKDALAMKHIAAVLEDMLAFLRVTAKSGDYFSGYSVSEMINERVQLIGKDTDEKGYDPTKDGWRGSSAATPSGERKRTLLDRLRLFEDTMDLIVEHAKTTVPALGGKKAEVSGTPATDVNSNG